MKNELKNSKGARGRGRPVGSTRIKLNKVETEDFLSSSLKEILNNHLSYKQYVNWCKKTHNISAEQSNTYWLRVWTLLTEKYQLDRENLINKHLQKYWSLYDMALEKEDISNARQVLESISKLLGMGEAEKLDVKQELRIRFKFGTDE